MRSKYVIDGHTAPALLLRMQAADSPDYVLNPANFVLLLKHNGYKQIALEAYNTFRSTYTKDATTWFKKMFEQYSKEYEEIPESVKYPGMVQSIAPAPLAPRSLTSSLSGNVPAETTWSGTSVFGEGVNVDEDDVTPGMNRSSSTGSGSTKSTPTTPQTSSAPSTGATPRTPAAKAPKSPHTLAYSNIKNKLLEEKREARRKRRALKKAQGTLTTASGGVEVMSDESEDDSNVSDPEEDSDFAAQVEAEVKRINSITSASWKPAATAGGSSSSTDNKEGI